MVWLPMAIPGHGLQSHIASGRGKRGSIGPGSEHGAGRKWLESRIPRRLRQVISPLVMPSGQPAGHGRQNAWWAKCRVSQLATLGRMGAAGINARVRAVTGNPQDVTAWSTSQ